MKKPIALTYREFQTLKAWGMPKEILHILDMIAQQTPSNSPECQRDLKLLDVFSGNAALSKLWREKGQKAQSYDIVDGAECDLRTTSGFQRLLHLALRLEEDALCVLGLPCTSYVFINKGTHCRTEDSPYGREDLQYVRDSNLLTTRAVMVLMVISVRCGFWLLEQPSSSQLIHHPELRFLLDLLAFITGYECQRFWMGHWGAPSPKLSLAWGNCPWIPELKKTMTREQREKLSSEGIAIKYQCPKTGKDKVCGGPKLKGTQVYPRKFAQRIYKLHSTCKASRGCQLRSCFAAAGPIKKVKVKGGSSTFFKRCNLAELRFYIKQRAAEGLYKPVF